MGPAWDPTGHKEGSRRRGTTTAWEGWGGLHGKYGENPSEHD